MAIESSQNWSPCPAPSYVDPQNNDLKNLHELVVGDTGAGKSFRVVIPDMLQMTGSYVVADVKGTLYRQTRQVMEDNGYKVRVLNLKDLRYSNCFNPLAYRMSMQHCRGRSPPVSSFGSHRGKTA